MGGIDQCPACACADATIVAALDAGNRDRFIEFDRRKYGGLMHGWLERLEPIVMRCDACGHCWYQHQPDAEQLAAMYAAGRPLAEKQVDTSREGTASMVAEMIRLRALLGGRHSPATLLDYGSGFGHWAHAASCAGFAVTAFEPIEERGMQVDAPFELIVDLEGARGRRFDAIQLEQVLEHLPNPLQTMISLRAFCHPRTIVRVSVPNLSRAPERSEIWRRWPFDGRSPHTLAPFEHLHGFTPRSLRVLAARAGFRSLPSAQIWRHHPQLAMRRILGSVDPTLDSTMMFLHAVQAATVINR